MEKNTFEKVGEYLEHYGVKGQKWDVRRYQYVDGSLTPEGREHYGVGPARDDGYVDSQGVAHIGLQFFADKKNEAEKVDLSRYSERQQAEMQALIKDVKLKEAYEKARASEEPPSFADVAPSIFSVSKDLFRERKKSGLVKKDYSDISDEELRRRVNRLNLEQSYGKLTGDTKAVMTGGDKVREFLQSAAIVATIIATIAPLLKKKTSATS